MTQYQNNNIIDNKKKIFINEFKRFCKDIDKLKIAVGYFYVSGFELTKTNLMSIKDIKIIMGDETDESTATQIDKGYEQQIHHNINMELNLMDEDDDSKIITLKELCDFIEHNRLKIRIYDSQKFHAKAYIFLSDNESRYNTAIVGSSNFSKNGMTKQGNVELNSIHTGNLEINELNQWYDSIWNESKDYKFGMLKILKTSQPYIRKIMGDQNYLSPIELLKSMFYESLNENMLEHQNVLAEFQEIGYINAKKKLEHFNGCIISDSVGLGKTFIGLKLIQDAQNCEKNVLLIVPKNIKENWENEIRRIGTNGKNFQIDENINKLKIMTITELSNYDLTESADYEILDNMKQNYQFVIIDEAHRFRNHGTFDGKKYSGNKNYANLNYIRTIGKQYVLLTATPLNNSILDLHNLLNIFLNPNTLTNYNSSLDFNDFDNYRLKQQQLKNEKEKPIQNETKIIELKNNLAKYLNGISQILEEIMILRTRTEIAKKYPDLKIDGKNIVFTLPKVYPKRYESSELYDEMYQNISDLLSDLSVPHISMINENAGLVLSGLYKILLYKRLESGIHSFVRSLERLLDKEIKLLDDIKKYGWGEVKKQRQTDTEYEKALDGDVELMDLITTNAVNTDSIVKDDDNIKLMIEDDISRINNFFDTYIDKIRISEYKYDDKKLIKLKEIMQKNPKQKILIFSQYVDTVNYLYKNLQPLQEFSNTTIDCITGSNNNDPIGTTVDIAHKINLFAPIANRYELKENEHEIDIMLATDSLSEGVNLQDCSIIINYDLPWNPTKIIQRVGRVDRIGSKNPTNVFNILPDTKLDVLLELLEKLNEKIHRITQIIGKENYIISEDDEEINTKTIGEKIKEIENVEYFGTYEKFGQNELLSNVKYDENEILDIINIKSIMHKMNLLDTNFKVYENPVYTVIDDDRPKRIFAMFRIYDKIKNDKIKNIVLGYDWNSDIFQQISISDLNLHEFSSGISKKHMHDKLDLDALIIKLNDHFNDNYYKKEKDRYKITNTIRDNPLPLQEYFITRLESIINTNTFDPDFIRDDNITNARKLLNSFKEIICTSSSINIFISSYLELNANQSASRTKMQNIDNDKFISILEKFYDEHIKINPDYSSLRNSHNIDFKMICWGAFI